MEWVSAARNDIAAAMEDDPVGRLPWPHAGHGKSWALEVFF